MQYNTNHKRLSRRP